MLHSAILPHHTKWFQLFEQLQLIVIDELHTYRGVFGGHVANVLRRLLRICAHYGSRPIIVCCSATIGNPGELAAMLTGRPARLVDRNGAPAGERHVLLVDPPLIEPASGARGSAVTLAQRWALPFLRAGRQTIVFGRSRVAVELLLTGLRESLRESYGPRSRVRGYRGGYLPTERRAIERGLRDGEILGVVSTNALELGVDIGRLDVSVLAGYPGSVAATWQQFGRAGRRQGTSVAILVASGAPVDQYVIHHPEFLLEGTPEEARLDPDNLHVLLAHLRAATFELPFEPGEVFGPGPADDLLAFLAEERHVRQAGDGRWYWSSENFPASEISLRTAAPENVVIIDTTPDRPRVLGEVDLFSAQVLVHERAIYIHDSVQYYVDRLEWHERKAYVHKIDVDHYTYANRAVTLKPLEVFAEAPATGGDRRHGEVMVASLVTLFKKLKFITDENVGWGPIDLPELELQTTAYWLTADRARDHWRRDELDVALLGAGRAIQTIAAVLLMVDPRDLGPRHPGPLPARGGADDLPVRGGARRDRAGAAALGAARRAARRGRRPDRRLRLRRRLPIVHRAAPRTERRCPGAGAAPAGRARGGRPARPSSRRPARPSWRGRRDRASRRWPGLGPRPPPGAVPRRGPGRGQPRDRSPPPRADPRHGPRRAACVDARRRGRDRPRRPVRAGGRPVGRHPGRSSQAGGVARPAAGRPSARLPRHRDDRARHGRRDGGLPHRSRLVGGRPVPPGPAAAARPCRRGSPAGRARAAHPPDAWLVTYNGRGFDWPLLVARFRMARRAAPVHDGHLDLLPIVRRLFRHRMDDARLQTVERSLLGVERHDDVDGWEIPGRYLGFLRGGPAEPLAAVVRHNDEDVRSLARLIALLDTGYTSPEARRTAPIGDVAGLSRAFVRARRPEEALACLEEVLERADAPVAAVVEVTRPVVALTPPPTEVPWWSPQARPDFGGAPRRRDRGPSSWHRTAAFAATWDAQRIALDRAHLLRRLGRHREAADAWAGVAAGPGRTAIVAWIELAKLREHRLGDVAGALDATLRGAAAADRRRQLALPEPTLEADLRHRLARLRRRLAARRSVA